MAQCEIFDSIVCVYRRISQFASFSADARHVLPMRAPQPDPTGGSFASVPERRMRAPRARVERYHERYDTTKNFAEVCGLWSKLRGRATHPYSKTLLQ